MDAVRRGLGEPASFGARESQGEGVPHSRAWKVFTDSSRGGKRIHGHTDLQAPRAGAQPGFHPPGRLVLLVIPSSDLFASRRREAPKVSRSRFFTDQAG